jgi:hypothetical protein
MHPPGSRKRVLLGAQQVDSSHDRTQRIAAAVEQLADLAGLP